VLPQNVCLSRDRDGVVNKASQRCFEVGFAYSNNATSKKELLQLELSRTAAPLGKVPRWVSQQLGYQAAGARAELG
jgi:hypothetical protein